LRKAGKANNTMMMTCHKHTAKDQKNGITYSFTVSPFLSEKGTGQLVSVIFLEVKSLQEYDCFNESSPTQSQTSSYMMHNHKSQCGMCATKVAQLKSPEM
jgi:hypothetical protein